MQTIQVPATTPSQPFWLRAQTNVPGVPGLQTERTQYGIQVFLLNAEPGCFTLTLTTESGVFTTTIEKGEMPTIWVVWFPEEQKEVKIMVVRQ